MCLSTRTIFELFFSVAVQEGAYLYENGIDPYAGDMYHENPLVLYSSHLLIKHAAPFIPGLFILCDLLCAFLLYRMSKTFIAKMVRFELEHTHRNFASFSFFRILFPSSTNSSEISSTSPRIRMSCKSKWPIWLMCPFSFWSHTYSIRTPFSIASHKRPPFGRTFFWPDSFTFCHANNYCLAVCAWHWKRNGISIQLC